MDQHSPTIHQLFGFKILNNCGVLIEFIPMIWNLSITTFYHSNNALSRMKSVLLMYLKVFRIHQYRWIFVQSTETIVWVNIHTLDIERIDFSSFPTQNRQNLNWTKTYTKIMVICLISLNFTRTLKFRFGTRFAFTFKFKYSVQLGILAKHFGLTFWKKKNVII